MEATLCMGWTFWEAVHMSWLFLRALDSALSPCGPSILGGVDDEKS